MKKIIENKLIKILTKQLLNNNCINTKSRTIYTGLYGMSLMFINPKETLALSILIKYFKYQVTETQIFPVFNSPLI